MDRRNLKADECEALAKALNGATFANVRAKLSVTEGTYDASSATTWGLDIVINGNAARVTKALSEATVRRRILAAYAPNDALSLSCFSRKSVEPAIRALEQRLKKEVWRACSRVDTSSVPAKIKAVRERAAKRQRDAAFQHGLQSLRNLLSGHLAGITEEELLEEWRSSACREVLAS